MHSAIKSIVNGETHVVELEDALVKVYRKWFQFKERSATEWLQMSSLAKKNVKKYIICKNEPTGDSFFVQ